MSAEMAGDRDLDPGLGLDEDKALIGLIKADKVDVDEGAESSDYLVDVETVISSDSLSDADDLVVEDYVWHQAENDSDDWDDHSSDGEPDYNLLKNAGCYTESEISKIYRSKLVKLKQLYERQTELLKVKYAASRHDYLGKVGNLRRLKLRFTTDPKYISRTDDLKYSEEYLQHQILTRLKTRAFMRQGRHTGKRKLLYSQAMKKRQDIMNATEDSNKTKEQREFEPEVVRKIRKPSPLCWFGMYAEEEKCLERAIPLSKFCKKHINKDKYQKLFISCGYRYGNGPDDICELPVFSSLEKFGCSLHTPLMPVKKDTAESKPKIEIEVEDLMKSLIDLSSSSSTSTDKESNAPSSEENSDRVMIQEMEHLIGDEVIDMEHFHDQVDQIFRKGVFETDSEESDDTETDEEAQNKLPGRAADVKIEL